MPTSPPRTVACPEPGCGAPIPVPESALVRFAACPRCSAQLDRARLVTLAPVSLPDSPPRPLPEVADTRARAPSTRTCSDPGCGTPTDRRTCPTCGSPTLVDAAFEADPLVGRVLDERFEVLERLGGGGFGAVYRARQLSMKRDVALKVVRSEWRQDREMAQRFVREAQLVARLEHPSAIRVHEFGQTDDGVLYLAMELLRGETLTARLARVGRFTPLDAVRTLSAVARTLVEAHAHGIVHRDLKPDNVFLHRPATGEEVVKVLDFGIAKMSQERGSLFQTGTPRTLGTPLYMAPEQIRSEPVDGRTDLYALGIVLHELLAGSPPFDGASAAEVMHRHETATPPDLPADVPPALRALCKRLLQKRPEDRPGSAEEVAAGLAAALVAPSAPRPTPPPPVPVPVPEPVRPLPPPQRVVDRPPTQPMVARVETRVLTFERKKGWFSRESVTERLTLAIVPPGRFMMGSPPSDVEADDSERPAHEVEIARPFELQTTPVTQSLWTSLMRTNPSHARGADRPVEQVGWLDAVRFCNTLSQAAGLEEAYVWRGDDVVWKGLDSDGYRLPTEAEWEYACRAGSTAPRYGDLDAVAWHRGNSGGWTHPVGHKQANAWGLHDMLGNVWEWTGDRFGTYPGGRVTDPVGSTEGTPRVTRGGSWWMVGRCVRAAHRSKSAPSYNNDNLGFRVARSIR